MHITNINDAKSQLSQLIKRTLAGDEVVIARNHEPLVKLTPIDRDLSPRQSGFMTGQIELVGTWEEAKRDIQEMFDEATGEGK